MKIGSTEIKHGLILAPMAGFTDYAMRRISYECGAEYSVTEMVSAKAVVFGDKKTYSLARITPEEGPVALQIFGSEPDIMAEGARLLCAAVSGGGAPVAIDINMGCPVPKIFKNGEGSALMRSPSLIYDIVRAVAGAVSLPVTVKLRLGIDAESINASECALAAEEGGAAAVALHGRTRVEMYSGRADYSRIARVREVLRIPLIANGDVTDFSSYLRIKEETGADGVMIGRGAIGNPFVFSEIACGISGEPRRVPGIEQIRETALRRLEYAISEKGEQIAVREVRKEIAFYFRGFRGSARLRAEINRATTLAQVRLAMDDCLADKDFA